MATALIEEYGIECEIRGGIISCAKRGDFDSVLWLWKRPEIGPYLSQMDLLRNKNGQVLYTTMKKGEILSTTR